MSQRIKFDIDKEVAINQLIFHQAGKLSKALMEAIQNALDAGASEIEITTIPKECFRYSWTDVHEITIRDDGKGLDNIDERFSVFARSNKTEEERGQFGIGRGQIFAKGITTWKTGDKTIIVDVQKDMLAGKPVGFDVSESVPIDGTEIHVKLYKKEPFDMDLSHLMLIANKVKLIWNGEVVESKLKRLIKRTEFDVYRTESDDGGVFLQDMYVCSLSSIGLTNMKYVINILSKEVKVNQARNEFITSHEETKNVLDQIKLFIKEQIVKRVKRARRADTTEKSFLTRRLSTLSDDQIESIKTVPFIQQSNGQSISLAEMNEMTICTATDDSRLDDTLVQEGYIVVDERMVSQLRDLTRRGIIIPVEIMDEYDSGEEARVKYKPNVKGKDTPTSKRELELMLIAHVIMEYCVKHSWAITKKRRIYFGTSNKANAWTDGEQSITINKKYLKFNKDQLVFLMIPIIVHEMTHTDTEDYHSDEFYKREAQLMEKIMADITFIKKMHIVRKGTKKYLAVHGDPDGLTTVYEPVR